MDLGQLNLKIHHFTVWNGEKMDGRFSNLGAAARRVDFHGSLSQGRKRGYVVRDDSTSDVWDYAACRKFIRDAHVIRIAA